MQYEAQDTGAASSTPDFSMSYGSGPSRVPTSTYNSSQLNFSLYGNSAVSLNSTNVPTPSPPPLMPRPPAEYIRETEEQDMRFRGELLNLGDHQPPFIGQINGKHENETLHRSMSSMTHPYAMSSESSTYPEAQSFTYPSKIPVHE